MKIFFITFICVSYTLALKNIERLNLVKGDFGDVSYKKLMINEDGVLSAPPLVELDVEKLKDYQCFENLRSNQRSLAIPIMFWNQTYMDKITKGINMISFFNKFKINISSSILPPSGILAYKLKWRRKSEYSTNNFINIDSSWYNTQFDYVLPKIQDFIIEFDSPNVTYDLCNITKKKLLNEKFQSQELAVIFMTRKVKAQNISKIFVTIRDIKNTKMFNDTKCEMKEKCYVSYRFAEKWAYEVSSNVMDHLNVVHLSLQKDIYDAVLNYLCKDKVPISEIESQTITKLVKDSSTEIGCSIKKVIFFTLEKLCKQPDFNPNYMYVNNYMYANNHIYGLNNCYNNKGNYESEIILSMNSTKSVDDRSLFTIPVKR